jgi:hypothetical protein
MAIIQVSPINSAPPIDPNLLLYLKGDTIADSSPFNRAIANTNVTVSGGALYFNGAARLDIASLVLHAINFSIELLVKPTNATQVAGLATQSDGSDNPYTFTLFQYAAYFALYNGSTIGNGLMPITTTQFSKIKFTRIDTIVSLYQNDALIFSASQGSVNRDYSLSPFKVGYGLGGIGYFTGYIKELIVMAL